MQNKFNKKLLTIILSLILLLGSSLASAQGVPKVSLKGTDTTGAPGSEFSVNLFLDTGTPVNAINLEVSFPQSELKFSNFDNSSSIIEIWQSTPGVLADGNVGFSGGMIKPFSGTSGLVGKLTFKTLTSGAAEINFSKSDVYLADGKGTKVEATKSGFTFTSIASAKVVSTPVVPFKSTPADVAIAKELQTYKSHIIWSKILAWGIGIIVFVIVSLVVYNYYKRKRSPFN